MSEASTKARLEREVEYHNMRFATGTRGTDEAGHAVDVDKFYSITNRSRNTYWEAIQANCAGKRILEYGCGTGSHAYALARAGARVTGIDISDVAVRQAQERTAAEGIEGLDFAVMNAEVLEFPNDTFDLICGTAIIHHLDLNKAFPELARTLKPGGQGLFLEPLGHNPVINLYRKRTPGVRTPDEHPLLMKDFKFARQFFGTVETRCFHLSSLMAVPFRKRRIFSKLVNFFDGFDAALFRLIPYLRRHAWASVVRLAEPKK